MFCDAKPPFTFRVGLVGHLPQRALLLASVVISDLLLASILLPKRPKLKWLPFSYDFPS